MSEGSCLPSPSAGLPQSMGRQYTVSIALPGSIIDNAQTQELKTYLAGQVSYEWLYGMAFNSLQYVY